MAAAAQAAPGRPADADLRLHDQPRGRSRHRRAAAWTPGRTRSPRRLRAARPFARRRAASPGAEDAARRRAPAAAPVPARLADPTLAAGAAPARQSDLPADDTRLRAHAGVRRAH